MSGFRLPWLLAGLVFLAIGVIGIVLPLLPTTPFLLLTTFCFARSSPRLNRWLLNHATFGALISNWQKYGSIDRRSKLIAIAVILLTPIATLLIGAPGWLIAAQIIVLACAATFILTRPEPPA
ncbi:MAG: YbaN family protein [Planctomycetes bacterium]|nr:YbaN family protein [Planctomycetota bacterium]